jgi:RNA polymerase sigma-70 factor (ECF subfamily)
MVDRFQASIGIVGGFVAAPPPAIPDSDPNLPAAAAPVPTATPEQVFALVYQQVRRLAGHRDVDELVQIAAEQAIRSLPRFAGRCALSTWTFRICYLTIRKHDRWYRRWLRRFTLTEDGQLPEATLEGRTSTDERMVGDERAGRLRAALDQLSPKRRTVVVLHDLEGFSIDEVAEIVRALPRAVRSRLRDGRRALAELLSRDPYFGVEACRGKARS